MKRLLVFLIPLMLLTACSVSEPSVLRKSDCGPDHGDNLNCTSDEKHEMNHGVDSDDSKMFTWEYSKLTHAPVNFSELMSENSRCPSYLPIQPYFNHFVVGHTEGPKKWYLATCSDQPLKVFMPAAVTVHKMGGINFAGSSSGNVVNTTGSVYDGNEVIYDTQIWGKASENISVFFMHLALLKSIYSSLTSSEEDFIVIEAGTHIGYIKNHESYEMEYQVIDFGVEDSQFDAGLTTSESWWNHRVNPFDYFIDDVKDALRVSYQPVYAELIEQGTHPFTNLEDSRANLNSNGEIWGTWFKVDSSGALNNAPAWSVIHLTRTQDLSLATYWKTLEENPGLSGILLESKRSPLIGKGLYNGSPKGKNKIFIESGEPSYGIAKVSHYYADPYSADETPLYWKYSVDAGSASKIDDTLVIEVFVDLEDARISEFSDKSVKFQRQPR